MIQAMIAHKTYTWDRGQWSGDEPVVCEILRQTTQAIDRVLADDFSFRPDPANDAARGAVARLGGVLMQDAERDPIPPDAVA